MCSSRADPAEPSCSASRGRRRRARVEERSSLLRLTEVALALVETQRVFPPLTRLGTTVCERKHRREATQGIGLLIDVVRLPREAHGLGGGALCLREAVFVRVR